MEAPTAIQLMEAVFPLLEMGYVPLGGAQVLSHRSDGMLSGSATFYQTMVFNEV